MMKGFESSWWYRGRFLVASKATTHIPANPLGRVLDMGAGFGGMFPLLSRFGSVDAYEPNKDATAVLKERGYQEVFAVTPTSSSHAHQYTLIGLFDVLEHIEDDESALKTLHDLLKEDGKCVITVPALQLLWSKHDVDCQHFRRYSASSLRALLARTGFEVQYLSYWNMTLFLPAYLSRKLGLASSEGETTGLPKVLDAFFSFIVRIESFLIPSVSLPFGTGLVVVAGKI